ncbi:MAG TPA: dihydrofolate reductase [Xanthobacteraceae bacterium]
MSTDPRLAIVAAVAENGVIGRDGELPWWLPGDLKHFKTLTIGKPVLMGRRTFRSIGRPLPGRSNIVLTHDRTFEAPGVLVARHLADGLMIAADEAERLHADEIMVIGGSALYAETLPRAERLYITEVHASPPGTTHFPHFERVEWREISRDGPHQGPGEPYAYSFTVLERR